MTLHFFHYNNKPLCARYGANPPLILALKVSSRYLQHRSYGLDIAGLLVAAGADVNAEDHQNQSALHWAAILRLPPSFFDLLMNFGARYFANKHKWSPLKLYNQTITSKMIDISKSVNSYTELGFHIVNWGEEIDVL